MSFLIQHKRRGFYVEHQFKPRFTWKRSEQEGKKFKTRAEAEEFMADKLPDIGARECSIVEIP